MYRLILQDWRSHIRSSLKRMWDNSGLFFVLIFYCIAGIGGQERNEFSYIFITFPCLIAYMLGRMYSGYLNKTFFLCPLDAASRRKYAVQSFRLRIGIPAILFLAGNVLLMCLGYFFIDIFLIRLFVFVCTAISVNIYCQPTFTKDWTDNRRYPFVGNFETINTYTHIINSIMIAILINVAEHAISELATWEIVTIAICMILQLMATICKVRRFYWQSIVLMDFYQ